MDFTKKYFNIFVNVFGLLTILFMTIAVPITIYYSFVIFPRSQADISDDCVKDLKRSSQELREFLVRETEQSKRWSRGTPLLQHWLMLQTYNWEKNKWVPKENSENSQALNLYQVSSFQVLTSLSHLSLPHVLSQELQLSELETGKAHLFTVLTISKNQLFAIVLPPTVIHDSLNPTRYCKKTILKSNGDFLFAGSSKKILDDLLVELQSSPALGLRTPIREVNLPNRQKFEVKTY